LKARLRTSGRMSRKENLLRMEHRAILKLQLRLIMEKILPKSSFLKFPNQSLLMMDLLPRSRSQMRILRSIEK